MDGGGGGGGGASLFANGSPADAAFVLEEGVGKRLVLTSGRGGDDWAALPFVLLFSIFRLAIPGAGMLDFRTGVERRGSISLFSFFNKTISTIELLAQVSNTSIPSIG